MVGDFDLSWIESYVVPWGIKLVAALLIFVVGKWLAGRVTRLLGRAMGRATRLDVTLINFIENIVYGVLLVVVVLAALGQLGIEVTSLIAILGAAGLAVGLALKDSLSNFAAGVMIMIFRPFRAGDFIEAAGSAGVVDEVQLFVTLMHTGDNRRIIVPNSHILGGTIVNVSALTTRRIDLVIGIGYDDNIGQARDLIMSVLQADERVLADPAPAVAVAELGDSSVNLNVRPWVASGDYWPARADLLERIKLVLDENGISIPYPQVDQHVHVVSKRLPV
jgi:small conductance mechanosensitive channel